MQVGMYDREHISHLEATIETEKDHSAFLEKLLKTLVGDGWNKLTISDAKEQRIRFESVLEAARWFIECNELIKYLAAYTQAFPDHQQNILAQDEAYQTFRKSIDALTRTVEEVG